MVCFWIHSRKRRKTICIRYGILCTFDGKIHTKKRQNRHLPLEFSIAMLACRNWTNQEIAEYLGLSMNTVKHYVSGILEKLGIDKRDKIKNFVNQ